MPELPEVETTTKGLEKEVTNLRILGVWTDLSTKDKRKHDTVSNPKYFIHFKKEITGTKIIKVERRAKNILIHLDNSKTLLVHMKMTGHLLYGTYMYNKKNTIWIPQENGPLQDPYNRFIHVVFSLSNGKHIAFCDSRKFGKITLFNTQEIHITKHLQALGPEPLHETSTLELFKERLIKKPRGKIKSVLMDQSVIVGIGNIYSDEILWSAEIHPEREVYSLTERETKKMFNAMKNILAKGIDFGGDSMSDYRNIYGLRGEFQMHHKAYRRTGEKCMKKNCSGVIIRKIIGGRSAHFCNTHQK